MTADDKTAALPEPAAILAFGPHPDDVEICAGGLLIRMARAGHRCVIVDMTRGEASTRGTPEERAAEAKAASAHLGLAARENLRLPDARLRPSADAEEAVVTAIRRWRPRLVLSPCREDLHPDHVAAATLVHRAYYASTIAGAPGGGLPAHRPDALIEYFGHLEPTPSFVVDVSDVMDARNAAIPVLSLAGAVACRPKRTDHQHRHGGVRSPPRSTTCVLGIAHRCALRRAVPGGARRARR